MSKLLTELSKIYKVKAGVLKDASNKKVSLDVFATTCASIDSSLTYAQIQKAYEELLASPAVTFNFSAADIFKDFEARGLKHRTLVIYFRTSDAEKICLGSALDLDARELYKQIRSTKALEVLIKRWRDLLLPYAEVLNFQLTDANIVNFFWEEQFTATLEMPYVEIDFSTPPAILEGFGVGSEITIPFKEKHATLEDLHPILKDFLLRMQDHEYFCAILAARLVGKQKHYIPWLYGRGGDGKSTFLRFLGLLVQGGVAEITLNDNQNGLWEALGKTFLVLPDASNKNIFHYEAVKKISGGDAVVINGKYKHPRTEVLPGLIIVSSNKLPNVGSYDYAKRRARVFKIASGTFADTKEELDVTDAAAAMYSTKDAFLNFCLQCLQNFGNLKTGFVEAPPSAKKLEQKSMEEYQYEDFIDENDLELSKDLKISRKGLFKLLKMEEQKYDKYFTENFLEYITTYCGVTLIGDKIKDYQGIGLKPKIGTQLKL